MKFVVYHWGGKRPYVVCHTVERGGGIALQKYGYRGHLVPRHFSTPEAAVRAVKKEYGDGAQVETTDQSA